MNRQLSPQEYWTKHTVARPEKFENAQQSLDWFYWRSLQYIGLLDLMPVHNVTGKVILDYGCGPGNDLVGFSNLSKPKRLIGMDVSSTAIEVSCGRLKLHNADVELIKIDETDNIIPLEDNSIDVINCAGVLQAVLNLDLVLKEFNRVLKSDGYCQIMMYNYDSIYMHLFVAYLKMIKEGLYKDLTKKEAFAKLTDGPDCPISRCYKPHEFIAEVSKFGFDCEYLGAAIYAWEMNWLKYRFDALLDKELDLESRQFLHDLEIDNRGFPVYKKHVAGIDACFKFTKPRSNHL